MHRPFLFFYFLLFTTLTTIEAFHASLPQSQASRLPTFVATQSSSADGEAPEPQPEGELTVLKPYLPALDPMYMHRGPIGQGTFVISRTGGPTLEELSNANMLQIVKCQCTDLEVNTLVWKCLGYRYDEKEQLWNDNALVFPNWREKYPTPPDFLGMRRVYEKDIDQPSLRANQALVRSVPVHAKQSLKTALKPEGWKGYQYKELTPNKTRRAQCANWLIFYRNELFGYTLEELRAKRQQQKEQQQEQEPTWSPPVKEVY
ncbi:hypothetical protein FisN_20Lh049 [Fistulifera solaris]|uniref:Uncharacterized protein n=1 Tax=Fistulifera solaris TaxID=1519565 RepID=A0A1Z5JW75_FISSO|nr:hypothetical protein FisN_20Lh049 [Fistulifera solaris]|eukprot:GAX18284.1 hypothetical protein FisN_20Lh049 [Fistulifera solaris]